MLPKSELRIVTQSTEPCRIGGAFAFLAIGGAALPFWVGLADLQKTVVHFIPSQWLTYLKTQQTSNPQGRGLWQIGCGQRNWPM